MIKELLGRSDYPNARRVNLISPNLRLVIEANQPSFNFAISHYPTVLTPLLFDYVSNGRERKIFDQLTRLNPDQVANLTQMVATGLKDTTIHYVFHHRVPVKEMKPLMRESMQIALKVQKRMPYEGRLRRSFVAKSDKLISELMDLLQQLQRREIK